MTHLKKVHVALNVSDVNRSAEFYRAMFGLEPVKWKPGYVKFDISEPPLNLTLNQDRQLNGRGALNHLGVEVASTDEVLAARERLQKAGLATFHEMNVDCCFALQDKTWISDPDYLGIGYAVLGLALSVLVVRDTSEHVRLEAEKQPKVGPVGFREVFTRTSFRDPTLFAACQAGLVNNLNDGMSWAIFPIFFAGHGLGVESIGVLKAVYPAIWGLLQTVTGPLSDRWGRKGLIVWGMWVQAAGPIHYGRAGSFWVVADRKRAARYRYGDGLPDTARCDFGCLASNLAGGSLSVYRFWRDMGYAVGALLAGLIGDAFGLAWAIAAIGVLTFLSGVVTMILLHETITAKKIE